MNLLSKSFRVLAELQNSRQITIHCNTHYTEFIHIIIQMGDTKIGETHLNVTVAPFYLLFSVSSFHVTRMGSKPYNM